MRSSAGTRFILCDLQPYRTDFAPLAFNFTNYVPDGPGPRNYSIHRLDELTQGPPWVNATL